MNFNCIAFQVPIAIALFATGCSQPRDPTIEENSHRSTEVVTDEECVAEVTIDGVNVREIDQTEWVLGKSITLTSRLLNPKLLSNLGPGDEAHNVVFYMAPIGEEFSGVGFPGMRFATVFIRMDQKAKTVECELGETIKSGEHKIYACYHPVNYTLAKNDLVILATFTANVLPSSVEVSSP